MSRIKCLPLVSSRHYTILQNDSSRFIISRWRSTTFLRCVQPLPVNQPYSRLDVTRVTNNFQPLRCEIERVSVDTSTISLTNLNRKACHEYRLAAGCCYYTRLCKYYAPLYILLQWSSAIGGLFTRQPFNTFTSVVDREKQCSFDCEILIL